jgi:XTP/dITP diphosphohydrolase
MSRGRADAAKPGLLVATRNPHKMREIRAILRIPRLELVPAGDLPWLPEVEEDGATFEQNAVKKAATLARASGMWAMADDSGLEVPALGGEPGVRSARYAGEPADYAANNALLLARLRGAADRGARFRCVVALAGPDGRARVAEGRCEGRIAGRARGRGGFGYDPLFVPDGFDRTFAQMKAAEKNRVSHRGRALRAARRAWAGELAALVRAPGASPRSPSRGRRKPAASGPSAA